MNCSHVPMSHGKGVQTIVLHTQSPMPCASPVALPVIIIPEYDYFIVLVVQQDASIPSYSWEKTWFPQPQVCQTPCREKLLQSVMQAWSDATSPRPQTRETWSGSVCCLQSAPNAAIIDGTSPGCFCRERVKLLVEHFCEVFSWVFLWGDLRIHLDHIFTLSATTSIIIVVPHNGRHYEYSHLSIFLKDIHCTCFVWLYILCIFLNVQFELPWQLPSALAQGN